MPGTSIDHGWVYSLDTKKTASIWDIYLLGIAVTMGGQFFSWNSGLDEGFWCFMVSTILMGIGYICLTLCLAEMMSTLPFTGGLYGFVRVAMNPFWGFIVAVCEVMQNVFYIAATLFYLGQTIVRLSGTGKDMYVMIWIMFFCVSIPIYVLGGAVFMRTIRFLAVYTFLMIIVFLIVSMINGDFETYADQKQDFEFDEVMQRFHLAGWFYIGIEHLPLAGIYSLRVSDVIRN